MIRYQPQPASAYQARRSALAEKLPVGSMVIAVNADFFPTNADAHHPYIPNSDYFYITGLDQPGGIFWAFKSENSWTESIFIPEATPHSQLWEGEKYSKEKAQTLSGCRNIQWVSSWKDHLISSIFKAEHVYINLPSTVSGILTAPERLASEIANLYQRPVESLAFWTHTLRAIKDSNELETIRRAIAITQQAFEQTAPKIPHLHFEYEIEAELTYHFIKQGAQGHAFDPIIASGKNACTLHYTTNHAPLTPGDLVLLDFGANWGHYKADITRVLPVSGKFTSRQIAIYEAVHQVLEQSKASLQIGMTLGQWKGMAQNAMTEALVALGMIKDDAPDKSDQTKKWFPHSIGHHLGLDVHDPCPIDLPIQSGMVITCEPGLYIPEENIGIRLETDLYVTDHGIVDLGERIPLHWRDIERMTKRTT